jgi:hypothetical protein
MLIIGPSEKQLIKLLVEKAIENEFSMDHMLDAHNGHKVPMPHELGLEIEIPQGYRIAYSHEWQPKGVSRHISVSVDAKNKVPSLEAFDMILGEFGFKGRAGNGNILENPTNIRIYKEDVEPGVIALNAIEPI